MGVVNTKLRDSGEWLEIDNDSKSTESDEQTKCSSNSAANFKWLNDRLYADTPYLLPSDNTGKTISSPELERSRSRHRVYVVLLGGLIHAPLEIKLKTRQSCDFLEIGCGLGDWCVNVAKDYPNVNVLGIDIFNTFKDTVRPKNCHFQVVNALNLPMPFDDDSFDLIHIEVFGLILTTTQQEEFLTEITRLLKPGGYFQWVEPDLELWNVGPEMKAFDKSMRQIMRLRSLDPHTPRKLEKMAKANDLIGIKHIFVSMPFGDWGKGNLEGLVAASNKQYTEGFGALCQVFCAAFGWTMEQFNAKKELALAEMMLFKSYQNVHLVVAGKPLTV